MTDLIEYVDKVDDDEDEEGERSLLAKIKMCCESSSKMDAA